MTIAAPTSEVVLRDGSTVHMRRTSAADGALVAALLDRLSPEALWQRFLGTVAVAAAAEHLVTEGTGLVALAGTPSRAVAHASFLPEAAGRAEVAFEVDGDWQDLGLATLLLGHLAQLSEAQGIAVFTAVVDPSNRRMLDVFRQSGFPLETRSEPGAVLLEMPAQLGSEALARFEERDDLAAVAAVRHVLTPSSIAVIGASRRRGGVGGVVVRNIVAGGFGGALYPINPHARSIAGRRAYASLADVPGPVELAIVAVSAEQVVATARACAAHGVRALVVLSAGFAETGPEGAARQAQLLGVCRDAGLRLVGPNCLGVLNTGPPARLDATFVPGRPPAGSVAFASQSGAYGIAALDLARRRGLGLSSFVSLGNKAELSGNDLVRFWEHDPRTDVVLLYLESLGNPRRFGHIARRVTASKPVIVVHSGRGAAGPRATSSRTGALIEGAGTTVDALFDHAGVVRVETLGEQLDVAAALVGQPLPRGERVAIVTNSGGPGIACADACAAAGLSVEPLQSATRAALRRLLPAAATVGNPLELLVAAPPADFRLAVEAVAADPGVDAVIAIYFPQLPGRDADPVIRAIGAAATRAGLPVLGVVMAPGVASVDAGVPAYPTPEQAARALGHAVRYARRRGRPDQPAVPPAGIDADAAAAILAEALAAGPRWLDSPDVDALLLAYGLPLAAARWATSPADAGARAAELGGPVALKALLPWVLHKTEAGAVRLGLEDAGAVTEAARELERRLGAQRFLVQAMAPPGVEMLVGLVGDPRFGPVVACGAGGTAVELLGDVQVRLAPLSTPEAGEMVRELRTFPLLDGFRGAARANVAALEDVVVRVAALGSAHPAVAELDLNPVVVTPGGAVVVDARVRVSDPPAPPPLPSIGH